MNRIRQPTLKLFQWARGGRRSLFWLSFFGGAIAVLLLVWFFGLISTERPTTEAFLTAIFSAVTAFATAVLAMFTVTLAKVGDRQVADTRILQRAYVTAEPLGVHALIEGDKVIGHIGIVNAGNLPAKKVAWFVTIKQSARGDKADFPVLEPKGSIIIVPRASAIRGSADFVSVQELLGAEAADKDDNAIQYLYVWGLVRYDDGFGEIRVTKSCHRYNWKTRGMGGRSSHSSRLQY